MTRMNDRMNPVHIVLTVILIVGFSAVATAEDRIAPTDTLQQALAKLPRTKAVVELPEASIIIEVNETRPTAMRVSRCFSTVKAGGMRGCSTRRVARSSRYT